MKKRSVTICTGGGGAHHNPPISAQVGVEGIASLLSSRTRFGIWPTIPVARNIGQMLKQVQHDMGVQRWLIGLPRGLRPLAMTPPVKAESCLGWSLKSHVQPLWMALSAFTMADRLSRFHNWQVGLRSAFTMAEILLSLTIIGVVAAITLPSLTGNINERTWNTQRKALFARFSQAIPLIDSLNTYANGETFVTGELSKVLKINNICDKEHLADCGIVSKFTTLNAGTKSTPKTLGELNIKMTNLLYSGVYMGSSRTFSYSQEDSDAVAFETQNGESIIMYYNPRCASDMNNTSDYYAQNRVCLNFIYDLNGNKGPNTVGKDIGFMSAIYPSDSKVVAPYPAINNAGSGAQNDASGLCTQYDDSYRIPSREELLSMFVNMELMGLTGGMFWSSSVASSNSAWLQSFNIGMQEVQPRSNNMLVRCVKR